MNNYHEEISSSNSPASLEEAILNIELYNDDLDIDDLFMS